VHRPRYNDWSLPKGKLTAGEHPLVAAVREVREETAIRAVPQIRLPSVHYQVTSTGADKTVDYWAMRASSWTKRASDREVDLVRWIRPSEATGLLTYPQDRQVVRAFVAQPLVTGLAVLVRHATAAPTDGWPGADDARPLAAEGMAEADALASVMAVFGVARIVTATPVRCAHTVAPLAKASGVQLELDARFNQDADPAAAADLLREFARSGDPAVVCGEGTLIASVLAVLSGRPAPQFTTQKGQGWLVAFTDSGLLAATPVAPSER
jgi:8-oxo-dGTP diphosphatase